MTAPVPVDDADDPRLADYVRLTDVHWRRSLEAAHGLFIAEGDRVVRRAVQAGYPVRSLLVTSDKLAAFAELAQACPGPAYVISPQTARLLTGYRMHRGVLAAMQRLPPPAVADVLLGAGRVVGARPSPAGEPAAAPALRPAPAGRPPPPIVGAEEIADHGQAGSAERHAGPPRRIIVLEDLVDHGNVGAIFRCAAALGVEAIILSPRCADPLYRRAARVSMGAVFTLPYARMTNWRGGLAELRAAGFRLLALTPDQSAVPIGAAAMGERVALLLGAEGDGLSSHWLAEADEPVCIPMAAGAIAAGVDSLNVVAAAAIACQALQA
jgi:tRNA G18 (ribose-2'-O)-methylase SpoU